MKSFFKLGLTSLKGIIFWDYFFDLNDMIAKISFNGPITLFIGVSKI